MEERLEKLEKQVNTLYQQDFPNQKALLDLQTKVGNLEKLLEEKISKEVYKRTSDNFLEWLEVELSKKTDKEFLAEKFNLLQEQLNKLNESPKSQLEVKKPGDVAIPKKEEPKKKLKLSELLKNLGL